jgi:hypothetical protein
MLVIVTRDIVIPSHREAQGRPRPDGHDGLIAAAVEDSSFDEMDSSCNEKMMLMVDEMGYGMKMKKRVYIGTCCRNYAIVS